MPVARTRPTLAPEVSALLVVWALTPLLSMSLATPVTFLAAAIRRGSVVLYAVTAGYAAAVGVMLVAAARLTQPIQAGPVGVAAVLLSLVGTAHAFMLRRATFVPAAGTDVETADVEAAGEGVPQPQGTRTDPEPPAGHQTPPVGPATDTAPPGLDAAAQARQRARELVAHDPATALQMGVGRPDLRSGFDDGGLVDVNHAPAEVLARLPGITPDLAWRIVQVRQQRGPYTRPQDLEVYAYLPPHVIAPLQEWLLFLR